MKFAVSVPVQLMLAATIVTSIVSMLIPESVEHPIHVRSAAASKSTPHSPAGDTRASGERPWVRPMLPDVIVAKSANPTLTGTPPLPPSDAKLEHGPTPPLPPIPTAPTPPDVTYLGRMIKDEKVQVFLASNGGNPVVLHEGEVFDSNWRVESISPTNVALQNLQSGENRLIAMGGNTEPGTRGIASVQIGQRFLASGPLHESNPVERQQNE
jgi:hypothetical protein